MKKIFLTIALLIVSGVIAIAQTSIQKSKMGPLMIMEGQWKGNGWVKSRDQQMHQFHQEEIIETKLDDLLITVHGQGFDADSNEKTYEAYGVLSYAPDEQQYIFNAYTMEGEYAQASATFKDNTLIWWFEIPHGTIQYEIKLTENQWIEDGYYISADKQKFPFFHMELQKE